MEGRDGRTAPDAGLLGCDREVFAQIWSRVSPGEGSVVEPVAPAGENALAEPRKEQATAPQTSAGAAPEEVGESDPGGQRLRELVLRLLTDGSVYRDLARRTRRSVGELRELYGQKVRQAKRASAAYFLLTGVRYWPREATPVNPPEAFFSALRERFLAEGRLARDLEGMAAENEGDLAQLYADLARETEDMAHAIRLIVERET